MLWNQHTWPATHACAHNGLHVMTKLYIETKLADVYNSTITTALHYLCIHANEKKLVKIIKSSCEQRALCDYYNYYVFVCLWLENRNRIWERI